MNKRIPPVPLWLKVFALLLAVAGLAHAQSRWDAVFWMVLIAFWCRHLLPPRKRRA